MNEFKVGEEYRFSQLPEEDTEELTVSEYGLEYLGQHGIHIRYHKTETDIWFVWVKQLNEGIFKCVYKD